MQVDFVGAINHSIGAVFQSIHFRLNGRFAHARRSDRPDVPEICGTLPLERDTHSVLSNPLHKLSLSTLILLGLSKN